MPPKNKERFYFFRQNKEKLNEEKSLIWHLRSHSFLRIFKFYCVIKLCLNKKYWNLKINLNLNPGPKNVLTTCLHNKLFWIFAKMRMISYLIDLYDLLSFLEIIKFVLDFSLFHLETTLLFTFHYLFFIFLFSFLLGLISFIWSRSKLLLKMN